MRIEFDEIEDLIESENRAIVFKFFLAFSRFEYALKRAGFLKKTKKRKAEADWDDFSRKNNAAFERLPKSQRLQSACDFIRENPPLKQINMNDVLDWIEILPQENAIFLENLLQMVRCVRNNLFHGGKFQPPFESVKEPARDRNLIQHSLTILEACLPLDPHVNSSFTETEWRQTHPAAQA